MRGLLSSTIRGVLAGALVGAALSGLVRLVDVSNRVRELFFGATSPQIAAHLALAAVPSLAVACGVLWFMRRKEIELTRGAMATSLGGTLAVVLSAPAVWPHTWQALVAYTGLGGLLSLALSALATLEHAYAPKCTARINSLLDSIGSRMPERFQFRVKTLILATVVLCLLLGLPLERVRRRRAAAEALLQRAGLAEPATVTSAQYKSWLAAGLGDDRRYDAVRSLDLSGQPITDRDLWGLAHFRALRSLDLSGTRVTSRCLAYIAELHGLRYLDVRGTKISRRAIADFARRGGGVRVVGDD